MKMKAILNVQDTQKRTARFRLFVRPWMLDVASLHTLAMDVLWKEHTMESLTTPSGKQV